MLKLKNGGRLGFPEISKLMHRSMLTCSNEWMKIRPDNFSDTDLPREEDDEDEDDEDGEEDEEELEESDELSILGKKSRNNDDGKVLDAGDEGSDCSGYW